MTPLLKFEEPWLTTYKCAACGCGIVTPLPPEETFEARCNRCGAQALVAIDGADAPCGYVLTELARAEVKP